MGDGERRTGEEIARQGRGTKRGEGGGGRGAQTYSVERLLLETAPTMQSDEVSQAFANNIPYPRPSAVTERNDQLIQPRTLFRFFLSSTVLYLVVPTHLCTVSYNIGRAKLSIALFSVQEPASTVRP